MYNNIKSLPSSGIFWNLTKKQRQFFCEFLENQQKRTTSKITTNNIAWYSSRYYSNIKSKSECKPLNWDDFFKLKEFIPLIFN